MTLWRVGRCTTVSHYKKWRQKVDLLRHSCSVQIEKLGFQARRLKKTDGFGATHTYNREGIALYCRSYYTLRRTPPLWLCRFIQSRRLALRMIRFFANPRALPHCHGGSATVARRRFRSKNPKLPQGKPVGFFWLCNRVFLQTLPTKVNLSDRR